MENVKSFKVYFDGHEKDRFITYFGTLGITHNFGTKTNLSLIGSAFYTKEQEKYDIQSQYCSTRPRRVRTWVLAPTLSMHATI